MGTYENIYERIMKKPTVKDITPSELQNFLEHCGFILKRVRGSHFTYGYPAYPKIITIPMNKKTVGPAYIDLVREIICDMEGK